MRQTIEAQPSTLRSALWTGLSQAMPIALGYIPIGFAYGVLASKAGLSAANTLLMSVIVFAGSAQLIAVGLFEAGAPALSILLTTFVVNLRHLLMSAALSPYLKNWRKSELVPFSFELTDETFALHSLRFASGRDGKLESFIINGIAQCAWVLGSFLGVVAGQLIQDVRPLALDYALPAMFIALLVMQLKDRIYLGIAILAGGLSVSLQLIGFDQWNVIVATLIAATVGVWVELWTKH